jgi:stearoyl-CoA desaturase (Delta-9 desaturase)
MTTDSKSRSELEPIAFRSGMRRISQVTVLTAVVIPPIGLVCAMGVFWNVGFHWVDLALFLGMYAACAFGTTIGFHRHFTHRSFEACSAVRATLAILGSMTMQGPLIQWVTDHRKHHALSDKPGDPHSPHGHGKGVWGAARGLVHAHVGWMFTDLGNEQSLRYGSDLYEDGLVRFSDRLYLLWVTMTLAIPFAIAYGFGGMKGGIEGLIWGGLIRIGAYQHATFSVNSICHMFGRRAYVSRDEARNNWLIALLVFGEGWHNNHHAFPASARHGLDRGQLDFSWWLIRSLEKLGYVWNVRTPTDEQRARRRITARSLPTEKTAVG